MGGVGFASTVDEVVAPPLRGTSPPVLGHGVGCMEQLGQRLGCEFFSREMGIEYAYLSGSLYRGIASNELVVAMGRSGFMGFLGAAGLPAERVVSDIDFIHRH